MTKFFLKITHLLYFNILHMNHSLTLNLTMKIPQPRLSEMLPKQPFYILGKLRIESRLVTSEVLNMLLHRVHVYVSHSHMYLITTTYISYVTHLWAHNMSNA